MAMNRFTNKYHRDIPHKPKKDKTMTDKTIEGIQSELKMYYQRHEEVVKTLGHINTEIRLLEDELKELVEKRESASPFDSAANMANMLNINKKE
tara:strand:+ start:266 stop:547 length:282 start_codon:yes stop_codon:yes gene_type:complete